MAEIKIPQEVIMSKILEIRGYNVMLDSDLADLYLVETRRLNEQVKRNSERFPEDFMFELTKEEWDILKSQNAMSSWGGRRKLPFVFTEHGVLMLSSVLNSSTAIKVNIQIMRTFTQMREMIANHQEIFKHLEEIRSNAKGHDKKLELIFNYLTQFEEAKRQQTEQDERPQIGYKSKKKK